VSRSTRSKNRSNPGSRRETADFTRRSLHRPLNSLLNDLGTTPTITLRQVQDLRSWHPLGEARPLLYTDTRKHRLVVKNVNRPTRSFVHVPSRVKFADSNRLVYCIRRKVRRQVMHALGFSGRRGRGAYRKPKFRFYSKISC